MTDTLGLLGRLGALSPALLGCSANLREPRGEEAEGLVFVSREGRSVAVEVARDAAAGGTGAVTERLYASLSLKLCNGKREQVPVSVSGKRGAALSTNLFIVTLL